MICYRGPTGTAREIPSRMGMFRGVSARVNLLNDFRKDPVKSWFINIVPEGFENDENNDPPHVILDLGMMSLINRADEISGAFGRIFDNKFIINPIWAPFFCLFTF